MMSPALWKSTPLLAPNHGATIGERVIQEGEGAMSPLSLLTNFFEHVLVSLQESATKNLVG